MSAPATGPRLRRVLIVGKSGAPAGTRMAADIGKWFSERGVEVVYEQTTGAALGRSSGGVSLADMGRELDLAVVAGGDGTLLSVARGAAPLEIPLLGVNLGSLGFLTELQPDELYPGLEAVLAGRYQVEERQTLRVRHTRAGRPCGEYALLNDAVITKSALARMINIRLCVDGEEVAVYTSDGLIVSTPTGSTAYSLSAGGPILDPRMRAFVIAPICPHTMTYRPLVVPATVTLEASLRDPDGAVYLTLDGQIGFPIEASDVLEIDSHPNPVRLVRVAGRGFFEVLRRKLRWGAR